MESVHVQSCIRIVKGQEITIFGTPPEAALGAIERLIFLYFMITKLGSDIVSVAGGIIDVKQQAVRCDGYPGQAGRSGFADFQSGPSEIRGLASGPARFGLNGILIVTDVCCIRIHRAFGEFRHEVPRQGLPCDADPCGIGVRVDDAQPTVDVLVSDEIGFFRSGRQGQMSSSKRSGAFCNAVRHLRFRQIVQGVLVFLFQVEGHWIQSHLNFNGRLFLNLQLGVLGKQSHDMVHLSLRVQ